MLSLIKLETLSLPKQEDKASVNLKLFYKRLAASLIELLMPISSSLSNSKEMLRLVKIEKLLEELSLIIRSKIYGRVFRLLPLLKVETWRGLRAGRKYINQ